jgi:hypothetical protein
VQHIPASALHASSNDIHLRCHAVTSAGCGAAETADRRAHGSTVPCTPEKCADNRTQRGANGSAPDRASNRFSLRTHLSRILLSFVQVKFVLLLGLALKIHDGPILMGACREQNAQA